MDERFRENAARAQLNTYKITFSITLIALIILCQGRLFGSLEYTLIATIIVLSLTLALGIFLRSICFTAMTTTTRRRRAENKTWPSLRAD